MLDANLLNPGDIVIGNLGPGSCYGIILRQWSSWSSVSPKVLVLNNKKQELSYSVLFPSSVLNARRIIRGDLSDRGMIEGAVREKLDKQWEGMRGIDKGSQKTILRNILSRVIEYEYKLPGRTI